MDYGQMNSFQRLGRLMVGFLIMAFAGFSFQARSVTAHGRCSTTLTQHLPITIGTATSGGGRVLVGSTAKIKGG